MSYSAEEKLAGNARRLYEDAKILHEHERHASAVALAVLATEEVGKYYVYRWKHEDPTWSPDRAFPPRHADKQAAFAAPFVALVQRQAMIEICKLFGAADWDKARGADDWEKTQDFLVEGYAISQHGETPEIRKRAVDILNVVAVFINRRVARHPLACLMQLADAGDIDKQKQAAIYLDVADDGAVKSDPAKIDKSAAAFWLDIAAVAVESLKSLEAAQAAAEQFARRYRVAPPPPEPNTMASAADWKELFEGSGQDGSSGPIRKR